jgi:hypothetical protein
VSWESLQETTGNPWLAAMGIALAGIAWGIGVHRCLDRLQQFLLERALPRIDERTYDLLTATGTGCGLLGTFVAASLGFPALGLAGGLFVTVVATALLGSIVPIFLAINAGADEG